MVASLVLLGGTLHWVAHLLLATGVAVQVSRIAGRSGAPLARLVRRTAPALLVVLLGLALVFPPARGWYERRAAAGLPAAPAGAPNVLLIIWDTVRAQSLGLYGYSRATTPLLERRAATGVVFDMAQSTAPWTAASHGSMFTGRLTQEMSIGWRTPLDRSDSTLAEALRRRGYRTGGFTANLIATTRESGLARGFGHYEDFVLSRELFLHSTLVGQRIKRWRPLGGGPLRFYDHKRAAQVTDAVLAWNGEQRDQPYFAFLNYFDAHDPYFAPPDWRERFPTGDRLQNKYDAAIQLLDAELERLLVELGRRGQLQNTIVILTADHGELFGEHGLHQHGNSLYQPLLHVPLVVWGAPGLPAGTRIPMPVSLRDLPATVLAMVAPGASSPFPGASLSRAWEAAPQTGDTLVSGAPRGIGTPPHEPVTRGNMSSLVAGTMQYILNGDGVEELYDLGADPAQLTNLAADTTRLGPWRAALGARVPPAWHQELRR
jgi:arylsulfatase A-like enzyme